MSGKAREKKLSAPFCSFSWSPHRRAHLAKFRRLHSSWHILFVTITIPAVDPPVIQVPGSSLWTTNMASVSYDWMNT